MELNTRQIIDILRQDKSSFPNFLGVFPRDRIPLKIKYPSSFILNTDKSNQKGEHWLAIYYDKEGNADFFDSYGRHPSEFKLEMFLSKTAKKWDYNKKQLQSFQSRVCGYYCVLFIMYRSRGFKMKEFLEKFSDFNLINDFILLSLIKD